MADFLSRTAALHCILMALFMQIVCSDGESEPKKESNTVVQRPIPIEQAAPWLVSSVSGFYIMARARRLSLAEASQAPLTKFLIHQSDLMLLLCGCPALWYFARHRRKFISSEELLASQARAIHQLRQVFTALMIGTGLLVRKASAGKTANLVSLAMRLNKIAREGAIALEDLGEPSELDQTGAPPGAPVKSNGAAH
jgi:hypothetical protein